jgi:hypothetical protein
MLVKKVELTIPDESWVMYQDIAKRTGQTMEQVFNSAMKMYDGMVMFQEVNTKFYKKLPNGEFEEFSFFQSND